MDEIWKPTPSFPGYEASSLGRIRSYCWNLGRGRTEMAATPKIKSAYVNENGYCIVSIGHSRRRRVHVLVADAFLGPNSGRMDVNHKDGNKQNNRADNLEYVTRSENHRHAFRMGLAKSPFSGRSGERHYGAKLKDRDVVTICDEYANGVPRRDLAARFSVTYETIWSITSRRSRAN